jgi:hypothetical protein
VAAAALPDGGFLRQIWTILADLKVVWREIFISGGFPISGVFLADLTYSSQVYFCLTDLAEFWRFLSLFKQKSSFVRTLPYTFFK